MDVRAFIAPVYAALILLFPLGLYFLVLAHVNRARRPVVIAGIWEAAGLLFGLSGFFLFLVPCLISTFYHRSIGGDGGLPFDALWERWSLVWLAYYLLLAGCGAFLLSGRRNKTAIFNVDPDQFAACLATALERQGLQASARDDRLVLHRIRTLTTAPIESPGGFQENLGGLLQEAAPVAELLVDAFPALAHVTLHWRYHERGLRRSVEKQLHAALEHATALENPAAGWFLGASGLIFGLITLLTAFALGLGLFGRRF